MNTQSLQVTGKPRPTIEWFYRNERIVASRKFELSNGDQILKVFPFLETDVGRYESLSVDNHHNIPFELRLPRS